MALALCLCLILSLLLPQDESLGVGAITIGGYSNIISGEASFSAVGVVASPVSYETIGLRLPLLKYTAIIGKIKRRIEDYAKAFQSYEGEGNAETATIRGIGKDIIFKLGPTVERLEKKLKDLQKIEDLARLDKRSIALLAAALGPIISIGSSLLNHAEVKALATKVARDGRRMIRMNHKLGHLMEQFYEHRRVEEAFLKEDLIVRDLERQLLLIDDSIHDTIQAFYSLLEHRLHPGFLSPVTLEYLEGIARNHSKRTGLTPVLGLTTEIMSMPISYVLGEQELLILLHIPMVQDFRRMVRPLYRLNGALMKGRGSIVIPETNRQLISVDKTRQFHQTLTEAELSGCMKTGTTFLCPFGSVLSKKVGTCAAALFFGDSDAASKLCKLKELELEVPILEINETAFAVRKGEGISLNCPGFKPSAVRRTLELEIINVKRGCTLSSETFVVTPPLTEHRDTVSVPHTLVLTNKKREETLWESFGGNISARITVKDLDGNWAKEDDPVDEEYYEDDSTFLDDIQSSWSAILNVVAAAIVIVMCASVATYCGCRHCNRRSSSKNPEEQRSLETRMPSSARICPPEVVEDSASTSTLSTGTAVPRASADRQQQGARDYRLDSLTDDLDRHPNRGYTNAGD